MVLRDHCALILADPGPKDTMSSSLHPPKAAGNGTRPTGAKIKPRPAACPKHRTPPAAIAKHSPGAQDLSVALVHYVTNSGAACRIPFLRVQSWTDNMHDVTCDACRASAAIETETAVLAPRKEQPVHAPHPAPGREDRLREMIAARRRRSK